LNIKQRVERILDTLTELIAYSLPILAIASVFLIVCLYLIQTFGPGALLLVLFPCLILSILAGRKYIPFLRQFHFSIYREKPKAKHKRLSTDGEWVNDVTAAITHEQAHFQAPLSTHERRS